MLDVAPTRDALKVAQSVRERRPARCHFTSAERPSLSYCPHTWLNDPLIFLPELWPISGAHRHAGCSAGDGEATPGRGEGSGMGWILISYAAMARHALRPTPFLPCSMSSPCYPAPFDPLHPIDPPHLMSIFGIMGQWLS